MRVHSGSSKTLALPVAILASASLWLSAAPQQADRALIDRFSADRTSIPASTRTTVTLSARINRSAPIPNSVNLIRVDPSGARTILGPMHDAGNGVYTISVTMDERKPGRVTLQVSGAFRGMQRRILSDPLNLTVTSSKKQ